MRPRSKRCSPIAGVDAVLVAQLPDGAGELRRTRRGPSSTALASLPAATRRGRNLFTAWLGEHSAAPARALFNAARIPTYETPEDGGDRLCCTASAISATRRC